MSAHELSRHRAEQLSELANWYALHCCGSQTPVDLLQIAATVNLPVHANNYKREFEGMLVCKNRQFHMHLHLDDDEHLYKPRVRFTMAHELGHFLIDEHRNALLAGADPHASFPLINQDLKVEREADHFAACLLMPSLSIQQDVFRRKFKAAIADEISTKYNVSATAALLRLCVLGNHPIMIVCSRDGMVQWYRHSYDFPFTRLLGGNKGRVPRNTSAGEYFFEKVKNTGKTETVFARDWYQLQNVADKSRQMHEYCYYYEKQNQVVSLIWED